MLYYYFVITVCLIICIWCLPQNNKLIPLSIFVSFSIIFIASLVTSHAPLITTTQSRNMRQVSIHISKQKENTRFMISPPKRRKARADSRKQIAPRYGALVQSLIEAPVFLRRRNKTVSILSVGTKGE